MDGKEGNERSSPEIRDAVDDVDEIEESEPETEVSVAEKEESEVQEVRKTKPVRRVDTKKLLSVYFDTGLADSFGDLAFWRDRSVSGGVCGILVLTCLTLMIADVWNVFSLIFFSLFVLFTGSALVSAIFSSLAIDIIPDVFRRWKNGTTEDKVREFSQTFGQAAGKSLTELVFVVRSLVMGNDLTLSAGVSFVFFLLYNFTKLVSPTMFCLLLVGGFFGLPLGYLQKKEQIDSVITSVDNLLHTAYDKVSSLVKSIPRARKSKKKDE